MRNLFIMQATSEEEAQGCTWAENLEEAEEIASWASEIVEVEGGWHAFESYQDYLVWCNQE